MEFIQKAVGFIEKSKKIIVIGYSFPLYNRLIDLSFLNATTLLGKSVYIQDPEAETLKATFSEGFGNDFSATPPSTICQAITDCNSFFVPKDVFIKALPFNFPLLTPVRGLFKLFAIWKM